VAGQRRADATRGGATHGEDGATTQQPRRD
jgi:hypothetical protein